MMRSLQLAASLGAAIAFGTRVGTTPEFPLDFAGFRMRLPDSVSDDNARRLFDAFDKDKDDYLTQTELMATGPIEKIPAHLIYDKFAARYVKCLENVEGPLNRLFECWLPAAIVVKFVEWLVKHFTPPSPPSPPPPPPPSPCGPSGSCAPQELCTQTSDCAIPADLTHPVCRTVEDGTTRCQDGQRHADCGQDSDCINKCRAGGKCS